MKEQLEKLLENSYSPYSHFKVAAIAVMKDGQEFGGVNVENAAYGSSICAERSAILCAISNGYTKGDFASIYVMSSSGEETTPCLACRQVFVELMDRDAKVICVSKHEQKVYTVADLCPYAFSAEDLK
jgi:cytidine deaminase